MIMIPLPFVLALVLGYFLLIELTRPRPRNRFACAFLLVLIVQLVIVGLRFGYGMETLRVVFPLTASLVGPLALLSFQNPDAFTGARSWRLLLHLTPLAVALVLIRFAPELIDFAQGAFTLLYAIALIVLGLHEQDTFPWVEFNRREYVRHALWCVVALALISSATDFVISVDAWRSRGANIPDIVGGTSVIFVVMLMSYIVWRKLFANDAPAARRVKATPGECSADAALLGRIDKLMATTQLHLDPELNLNRMARKLGVPARQVSAAINRQRLVSVSQYINQLRIDEACRLLRDTDLPITRIMLQSGFVTKSHFNREFSRRFSQSPTAWRATLSAQQ